MARIEFCGGIGVGKSTLAAAVAARLGRPLVRERFEDNPYWRKHYGDPSRFALEKDLSFLLSHADELRAAADADPAVCDFAMFQTVAYSVAAGEPADTTAVRAVFARMAARLGHPALVVRLRCPAELQLRRIAARGRAPEAGLDAGHLRRLNAAIDGETARLPAAVRVVELDATLPPAALAEAPALADALRAVAG